MAAMQLQLDAARQHTTELEQELQLKSQECADSCGTAREQAAALALLQQQLQAWEAKLLDQAQQRGQEQQQWQQQVEATQQQAQARVRTPGCIAGGSWATKKLLMLCITCVVAGHVRLAGWHADSQACVCMFMA